MIDYDYLILRMWDN